MRLDDIHLPKGWRHPASRKALKTAFADLPGHIMLRHRPYSQGAFPPEDEGLLLRATISEGSELHPELAASVYVYGIRVDRYSDEAARDFLPLLKEAAKHLRRAVAAPMPADGYRYASFEVRWDGCRHSVERVPVESPTV